MKFANNTSRTLSFHTHRETHIDGGMERQAAHERDEKNPQFHNWRGANVNCDFFFFFSDFVTLGSGKKEHTYAAANTNEKADWHVRVHETNACGKKISDWYAQIIKPYN